MSRSTRSQWFGAMAFGRIGRKNERAARLPYRRRLRFEPLEERLALATFLVTNLNDAGAGSLRQAALDAVASSEDDVINFQSGLTGTITLTSGQIALSGTVELNGPGADDLTVSGNNASRIFETSGDVTIRGLRLTDGASPGFDNGGAIFNHMNASLTVADSVITGNAASRGGGIYNHLHASLTVADSVISGNSAPAGGGGIYNRHNASLTVADSVIDGNSADVGGGIQSGQSSVTITRSTLSNNMASLSGGGIFAEGTQVTITESTFSGNSALFSGAAVLSATTTTIANSTFANNQVSYQYKNLDIVDGEVTITNTTFSDAPSPPSPSIYSIVVTYDGKLTMNNVTHWKDHDGIAESMFIDNGSTLTMNNSILSGQLGYYSTANRIFGLNNWVFEWQSNTINQPPYGFLLYPYPGVSLGPLADNGGPTLTHAHLPGSGSINGGSNAALVDGSPFDQRGPGYWRFAGGVVDLGAVEDQTVHPGGPVDVALVGRTVAENSPVGTVIGTLSTTDHPAPSGPHTYSVVGDPRFQVVGNVLQVAGPIDFEQGPVINVGVRSTDSGGRSLDRYFKLTVINANDGPTDLKLSSNILLFPLPVGAALGTLTTTDVDAGDSHTYTMVDDAGGQIGTAGNQLIVAGPLLGPNPTVRVRSTDAGGLSVERDFTLLMTRMADPTYTELSGGANPLGGFDIPGESTPAIGDLDADGRLDLVVGNGAGVLRYFRNTGTAIAPSYVELLGLTNPFDGIDVGTDSTPALGDLDSDGDLDLVTGSFNGGFRFYRNTGIATLPAFTHVTGAGNPFDGINAGNGLTPALADLDADGDLDLVTGTQSSNLAYYLNTGGATNPIFVQQQGAANPFAGLVNFGFTVPALGDLDGDGDLDLAVGDLYFRNTGSSVAPAFLAQAGPLNPLSGIDIGQGAALAMGDLDGDGDLDLVAGSVGSALRYFRASVPIALPWYHLVTDSFYPFELIPVVPETFVAPALGDLDGDGDLDIVVGRSDGTLRYLRNAGSTSAVPGYQDIAISPVTSIDVGTNAAPALADLDADGDLDLVIGAGDGTVRFYRNTGSAAAATFTLETGSNDPFNGIDIGASATPALADLNGDGELDLVLGTSAGSLHYYRNFGTANNPAFVEQTGFDNPFSLITNAFFAGPALVDLDRDADFDLVLAGGSPSSVLFYRNIGSVLLPLYVEQTGPQNPLGVVPGGDFLKPALADLDGDGDADLVLGDRHGNFRYWRGFLDNVAPAADAHASNVPMPGATSYSFTVRFRDNTAIDVAALGNDDVRVTGPSGFSEMATFVSVDLNTNGTPRSATYQVTPPGGAWDVADDGTYTVTMAGGNRVFDLNRNFVPSGVTLGTFQVHIGQPLLGDYNRDGAADAADYVVWRKTLGTSGVTLFSGADGSGNGAIGSEDYGVWTTNFGTSLPAAANSAAAHAQVETPSSPQPVHSAGERLEAAGLLWDTFAARETPLRVADMRPATPRVFSQQHDARDAAFLALLEHSDAYSISDDPVAERSRAEQENPDRPAPTANGLDEAFEWFQV